MSDTTPEPTEAQNEPTEVTEAAEAAEAAIDAEASLSDEDAQRLAQLTVLAEERHQAQVIYSLIDDGLGNDMLIGWDTCGRCFLHIRQCKCADGPHRPVYIEKFAFQPPPERQPYVPLPERTEGTMHVGTVPATELVDVQMDVEVATPEPDRTPSGRRKRKDAGQKRGPRNAEATQNAAEELSQALKERNG